MRDSRKWLMLAAVLRSMQDVTKKLVLLLVVFLSVHLDATTYYVAKTGNDTNPGTSGLPLLTIQAGVNKAYPGDAVMVLAGTYNEQVTFQRSGTAGLPIVVRGDTNSSGEPLAVVDNTTDVGATWTAAPEIGDGVYKRLGFHPVIMRWNGYEILRINAARMAGDETHLDYSGFEILNFDSSEIWHPTSEYASHHFWQDVQMIYGVLNGDTAYIRYVDRDWNPDTCDLVANESSEPAFRLGGNDYITIDHLAIQGCLYGILLDSSDHNRIQHCNIKNGNSRVSVATGSASNTIEHNEFTWGQGPWLRLGEWNDGPSGEYLRHAHAYILGKFVQGYNVSSDIGVVLGGTGEGNVIDSNHTNRGDIATYLWSAPSTQVFGNEIESCPSIGLYVGAAESLRVFDNYFAHCNLAMRFGDLGSEDPLNRSGYIYNNRAYNDSGYGGFVRFHAAGSNPDNPATFNFYHNSYAGGQEFGVITGLSLHMKFLNNIWSSEWLSVNGVPALDTQSTNITAGCDYNFMGGRYAGRRYSWAFYDRHNQWAADTINGDFNHQVWPIGSEPDWVVPETSTAYQSGLDLSDSFTVRGVKYGPLPGMTPGYFTGDKPNLGAVQNTSRVGMPQHDPGHGSVTQLPELAFAPNPAAGRDVTVRCAIPNGQVGRLAVRDVLGRTVKSIALVTSGITRLDLRNLAPGIYIAALDAGGPPVSRKLIITH